MTEGQLALNRYILEQVKEGKPLTITNNEKVDLDFMVNYYNNLLLDIEREKKRKKAGRGDLIAYSLFVEIDK